MQRILLLIVLLSVASTVPIVAEEADATLLGKLGEGKHSLLDGIAQAEKDNGMAISAKFELEDGKLMLSVYTAKDGRDKCAESNALIELNGDASGTNWRPNKEVFEDKAHIARASMQLTLMQLTKLGLADIIKKAAATQKGTVYSAIPSIRGNKPVVDVLIFNEGKSSALSLDLQTGNVVK